MKNVYITIVGIPFTPNPHSYKPYYTNNYISYSE